MFDRDGGSRRPGARALDEAIARFLQRKRQADCERDGAAPLETMTPPAFRAIVADRLRSLERDVAEVRTRVNGLLFVVAGAVATQVVLRLFA